MLVKRLLRISALGIMPVKFMQQAGGTRKVAGATQSQPEAQAVGRGQHWHAYHQLSLGRKISSAQPLPRSRLQRAICQMHAAGGL